jgi:hypothetical protein
MNGSRDKRRKPEMLISAAKVEIIERPRFHRLPGYVAKIDGQTLTDSIGRVRVFTNAIAARHAAERAIRKDRPCCL